MFDLFLGDFPWDKIAMYFALGLFAALVIALIVISALKKTALFTTRDIAFAAICIALAYALSFIRIYRMPQGGSITPASTLPLMLYAYFFGFKRGIFVGLIYSLLQIIQDPQIYNPFQVLLDYPLAFSAVAATGLFKRWGKAGFVIGGVTFALFRFLCHFLSGVVFFGIWAPEGMPVALYSLLYQFYVPVDAAIAVALGVILLSSNNLTARLTLYAAQPKAQIIDWDAPQKDNTH